MYIAIQYSIKIIKCKSDAVIRYPALRKVVSSDFSTPVPGTNQAFSVTGNFIFLFSYLLFI